MSTNGEAQDRRLLDLLLGRIVELADDESFPPLFESKEPLREPDEAEMQDVRQRIDRFVRQRAQHYTALLPEVAELIGPPDYLPIKHDPIGPPNLKWPQPETTHPIQLPGNYLPIKHDPIEPIELPGNYLPIKHDPIEPL